jgi:capsular polysaccharide export protein
VLVTGQVADDRSVLRGGGGLDNLALLRRARTHEPDAHIVFKPHPDVEAGHRKGHVPDAQALEYADEIDRTSSIAALLDRVDAVHVLTSLAGFEALMRGREVVTHGVPFYAGWGLTHDLGAVPARRTRQRTLDELVAATLILYPRYLDPVTRLPCEPEILVERIAGGQAEVRSGLIRLREAQGRIKRVLGWIMGR